MRPYSSWFCLQTDLHFVVAHTVLFKLQFGSLHAEGFDAWIFDCSVPKVKLCRGESNDPVHLFKPFIFVLFFVGFFLFFILCILNRKNDPDSCSQCYKFETAFRGNSVSVHIDAQFLTPQIGKYCKVHFIIFNELKKINQDWHFKTFRLWAIRNMSFYGLGDLK